MAWPSQAMPAPDVHRPRNLKRASWIGLAGLVFVALLAFVPQLVLVARFDSQIYLQLHQVPAREYGVVFGAYVDRDRILSDAALERVEAAIQLYRQGTIQKLFISGDNRSNEQAGAIAAYALDHGVAEEDIIIDGLGIDTHDTCRHLARVASEGILLTQEYHLPRAMYMCEHEGIESLGVAVNRLGILAERGSDPVAIWSTRAVRFTRESALTWLFVLGLYDRFSNEAESIEAQASQSP